MAAVTGSLLACVIVAGRVTGIVVRDCYPCLPSTLVYFDVPNDRHEKAANHGGLIVSLVISVVCHFVTDTASSESAGKARE